MCALFSESKCNPLTRNYLNGHSQLYSCFAFRKRDVTEAKNWLSNVYPPPVGGAKPEHTEELETHLTPLFNVCSLSRYSSPWWCHCGAVQWVIPVSVWSRPSSDTCRTAELAWVCWWPVSSLWGLPRPHPSPQRSAESSGLYGGASPWKGQQSAAWCTWPAKQRQWVWILWLKYLLFMTKYMTYKHPLIMLQTFNEGLVTTQVFKT